MAGDEVRWLATRLIEPVIVTGTCGDPSERDAAAFPQALKRGECQGHALT